MDRRVYQYYVEGECEKNFLSSFMHAKSSEYIIHPGKIEKLNPVTSKISETKARTIKRDTRIVFVFDTDVENTSILEENIKTLKRIAFIEGKDIIFLMSVKRFEEEIVFSCSNIKDVKGLIKLFNSQGLSAFKTDFSHCKNLEDKLKQAGFEIKTMWIRSASQPFDKFENGGKHIIIKDN
ncbi:MAG: hypothetical protein J6T25_03485 [Bacilli bacterium]|nr:hypothetical protein [Bacilli bacterium]